MARTIAVVNQKGGVGKTTTSVNLGVALAEQGQRVLLVDLDSQANATSGVGVNWRDLPVGMYEVLLGELPIDAILHPTDHDGLSVAPATSALAGAQIELVTASERERKLADALAPIAEEFDTILLDCAPTLGLVTVNALAAADEVLIPVQAEYYALEGLGQLLETILLAQERLTPKLAVLGAVLTMYERKTMLSDAVWLDLYRNFPHRIFRSVIPRSVRLAEAPSHGKTIFGFDRGSRAARAYEKLAREVMWAHSIAGNE